jgi:hypothetical protein
MGRLRVYCQLREPTKLSAMKVFEPIYCNSTALY